MCQRILHNLILVFFVSSGFAHATNYYVKNGGGTGSGLDDANAWNLARLNATKLAPGDHVFLKRGDVFYGSYTSNSAGSADNPITFDAYGSGANPVISGLTELTTWTRAADGIYFAYLDVPALNLVTIDGQIKPMGRYPDQGYLPYTSHDGKTAIAGESVAKLPFDPTGGELVIRKSRWILDRHRVQSRYQEKLTLLLDKTYGDNSRYTPVDGNGFFIQNHLSTLNREGEWYYDKAAKRLYVYFGSAATAGRVVKASTLPQNLYLNHWANLSFNHIDLDGGNLYGAYVIGTSNISFNDCNVRNQGGDGIWGSYLTNLQIRNSTVTACLNNGIFIEQQGSNITIDRVRVTDSGSIAGSGRSGDGAQEGIFIVGERMKITHCSVLNSGYIGINFQGNDVLVEHNLVNGFSSIKDDGAGIYTYNPGYGSANRIIRKNIVLNAIGAFAGAEGHYWEPFGKAAGIYVDDRSDNTLVDQNTVAHGSWGGIFLHNTGNVQITNNLVYDFGQQLLFALESAETNVNFTVTGNQFIARKSSQKSLQINLAARHDIRAMGRFEHNVYARPVDDNQTVTVDQTFAGGGGATNYSLESWKSEFEQDLKSSRSKVITDQESNLLFEYNPTSVDKVVNINASYADVAANRYISKVILPAYSGIVLVRIPDTGLVESLGSGDWNHPQLWSGGFVPGASDNIRINKGHKIDVEQDISSYHINVSSGGELHFPASY